MRRLIFISMVLAILSTGCQRKKDNVEDTGVVEEVVLEDNVDEVQPNPSDISFILALEEYQEGEYEKAANTIEDGVIELREEEKSTEMINGRLLDEAIVKLRSMEDKVRAHKIEDIDMLSQAMVNAEMLVAHDYLIYTINSITENPSKTVYYFDKAMESLDRAIPKLSGNTKQEAVDIRNESMKIANNLETDSGKAKSDLERQTKRIRTFLQKHANEIL